MSTDLTEPVQPVEVDVDQPAEVDADEAEYQATMAKLRGEKPEAEEPDEAELDDEDREYQETMAKLRGEKDKAAKEKPTKPKEVAQKKEEATDEKKIWKLKVDGEEVDFDASNEELVKRKVQEGLAGQKRMQESARIKRQAENFIEALRTNPEAVLSHPSLGVNLRKFCEDYLYKHIQRESLSPEERSRLENEEELKRYRERDEQAKAKAKQEAKAKEDDELKERYRQDWSKKFKEALDTGGLPKTDWTISRMAMYMRQALANGRKHIEPSDVVDLVKEDWLAAVKQFHADLDGEKLIEVIGQEAADKIRKANLARYEKQQGAVERPEPREARTRERTQTRTYGSTQEMMRDSARRRRA